MSQKISDTYLFLPTIKALWEMAHQAHSKEHDESQIYQLVQKSIVLMQGGRLVTEYAGELECMWREIDHYRPVMNPDSEERQYTLKDRLYKYLMGLNSEYETLVSQILTREKVPNFKEALKLVVWEESTWHLRSDLKVNPESAVFAARRGKELQGQPVSKDQKEGK